MHHYMSEPEVESLVAQWSGHPWRAPSHGKCCTCQTCGYPNDEPCWCGFFGNYDKIERVLPLVLAQGYRLSIVMSPPSRAIDLVGVTVERQEGQTLSFVGVWTVFDKDLASAITRAVGWIAGRDLSRLESHMCATDVEVVPDKDNPGDWVIQDTQGIGDYRYLSTVPMTDVADDCKKGIVTEVAAFLNSRGIKDITGPGRAPGV